MKFNIKINIFKYYQYCIQVKLMDVCSSILTKDVLNHKILMPFPNRYSKHLKERMYVFPLIKSNILLYLSYFDLNF